MSGVQSCAGQCGWHHGRRSEVSWGAAACTFTDNENGMIQDDSFRAAWKVLGLMKCCQPVECTVDSSVYIKYVCDIVWDVLLIARPRREALCRLIGHNQGYIESAPAELHRCLQQTSSHNFFCHFLSFFYKFCYAFCTITLKMVASKLTGFIQIKNRIHIYTLIYTN